MQILMHDLNANVYITHTNMEKEASEECVVDDSSQEYLSEKILKLIKYWERKFWKKGKD